MRLLRERLTFANVVSVAALFIALGTGGAYAADQIRSKDIAKNAVKSKHIAKKAVKSRHVNGGTIRARHLRDGAVNSAKVADGSLLAVDFADGQLPQGAQGPIGDTGPQGEPGPPGPTLGAVRSIGSGAPPPPGEHTGIMTEITTPVAGRLMVFGHAGLNAASSTAVRVDCNPNAPGTVGLYVNGTGVAGTAMRVPDNVAVAYSATGITGVLPAGTHTIQVNFNCDGPSTPIGSSSDLHSLGAVLLGS